MLRRLILAAALAFGVAGAAAAAPMPDKPLTLSDEVGVTWTRHHGHHYGWRHHRRHYGWGHRRYRHYGFYHRRHYGWRYHRRHVRHYGWYRGRHYGWRHHRRYRVVRFY